MSHQPPLIHTFLSEGNEFKRQSKNNSWKTIPVLVTLTADRSRRDRPLHDLPLLVTDRADRHHRNLQQHFSDRDDGRNGEGTSHSRGNKGNLPAYQIIKAMTPPKRITKKNEFCDPASATLVCPDLRIQNGSPAIPNYHKPAC